ncbi:MAG: CMP/dCMP kinase [Solirubrobacteraceae bacterium]|nr:CMP/dCMP kinase [Solirubrobacteraceae bacterium]
MGTIITVMVTRTPVGGRCAPARPYAQCVLIAIDGPAGAGKSTVARAVADALGFTYLDTGAMYRCVALAELRGAPDPVACAIGLGRRITLDGDDVTDAIRAPEVSEHASQVAARPEVRGQLVALQRKLIRSGDYVAEGRDIGTVVAPDAALKVFLTASPRERARRRAEQLGADVEEVLAEQEGRDRRDETREHSPLAPAPDALRLDTDGLGVDEVVQKIVRLATAVR